MQNKILIVDDALFMRAMLKKILKEAGYTEIFEAANGVEACTVYEAEKPDAVLMDISMPEMNGIEALKAIVREDADAVVVMCSAVGQEAMILEAVQSGALDFIVKPFKPEQIIQAVETALDKKRGGDPT
ncbi:response regulator [Eubacterium limosum]|uniref:response regulator n=1 Tax=Eubacterium limosum TaxID=1736 RepID=UPI0010635D39|nr:response regulator [Eubacterium limosum]